MQCVTIKNGIECSFMSKKGCTFTNNACNTIVSQCEGCGHVMEFNGRSYCKTYADPSMKWSFGSCNFATHVEAPKVAEQKTVNPLKASKRASRGR